MVSREDKIKDKDFLIKMYPNLLEIKKVIPTITQNNYADIQLSILGKLSSNNSHEENGFDHMTTDTRILLNKAIGRPIRFGYFNKSDIGILFIAGHLTDTFLQKVDQKELASLPVGLFGIFRGIGIELEYIDHYIQELKNGNILLIIRGEKKSLERIKIFLIS